MTTLALAALVGGCSDDDDSGAADGDRATVRPGARALDHGHHVPVADRRGPAGAAPGRRHRGPQPVGALGHRLPARRHRDRHRARHPAGAHDRRARQGDRDRLGAGGRAPGRGRTARGRRLPRLRARTGLVFLYVTTRRGQPDHARPAIASGRLGPPEVDARRHPQRLHPRRRAPAVRARTATSTPPPARPAPPSSPRTATPSAARSCGSPPTATPRPGNPDPSSPIWTLGHRNVQGLAFDDQDNLWASEFGDSTFDELNLIRKGGNYGWPRFEGRGDDPDFINPQVVWDTSEASPSGLAYLDGRLWLGALKGERLWRIDVADGRATKPTDFFVGRYGRLRTVVVAPDGNLWVSTSNRDGRATPGPDDDQILVVDPALSRPASRDRRPGPPGSRRTRARRTPRARRRCTPPSRRQTEQHQRPRRRQPRPGPRPARGTVDQHARTAVTASTSDGDQRRHRRRPRRSRARRPAPRGRPRVQAGARRRG